MSRWVCIIALYLCWVGLSAQRVSLSLYDVPLSEALRQIDQGQQERRIVFVFNEMERFRVSCQLSQAEPLEAVRQVCASLPIRIKTKGRHVFVEAEHLKADKVPSTPATQLKPLHEVRMLDEVTVVRKRIRYGANGYTALIEAHDMTASEALAYLPNLMREEDRLYVHGQMVSQIFLDGMPISSLDELDQLQGDMIEEVRIDYQPCTIYIALRQPNEGGFYGSVHSLLTSQGEAGVMGEAGAVWYMRHKGLSLYNRFGYDGSNRTEQMRHSYTQGGAISAFQGENERRHNMLSNRFSINREFNRRHTLGASLYMAFDNGKASSVMEQDRKYYFDGDNEHTDTELTLKYTHTFGPHNGTMELLFDVFDRSAQNENLSLYGAGVGTELGESPSITLRRVSMDIRQPMNDHRTTLLYRLDGRSFVSQYDPERYNNNLIGAPVIAFFDQSGQMLQAGFEAQHVSPGLLVSGGLDYKLNHVEADFVEGRYSQHSLAPHLRIELPLGADGRHRLSLAGQRQLDDIPYASLSPAVRWNDAFNFTMGNTSLRAPITSQLMANASLWQDRLNLTATYRWIQDEVYWQTSIAKGQTDVFYTQSVNIPHLRTWSLHGELNLHPTAWWQAKVTAQMHYRMEDATLAQTHYQGGHLQQRYTMDHHLRFDGHWSASLHAVSEPQYRIYDRTYHATYLVSGEVQKGWLDNRLQTSLLFVPLGRNRQIDRQIDERLICYKYCTSLQQLGIRVVWNFSGGRRVKVGAIEGGQRFDESQSDL